MAEYYKNLPLSELEIWELKAGDQIYLTGKVYTGRDAAHKRLVEALESGKELPFEINKSTLYYVGPCPAKPGEIIGSCGPTTSYRMDDYTPALLDKGLQIMIGKGRRSSQVIKSMIENKSVYLAAIGGAGALIKNSIKSAKIIAYDDLGTEAVRELIVENFPAIVAIDARGNSLYANTKKGDSKC